MAGFVKVYGTILQSSVWLESPTTRVLWITMLALADSEGIVRASLPGLAHAAHIRVPDCSRSLLLLAAEDAHSRSEENGGRRIQELPGGWLILNYMKYRELRTEDQIAAAARQQRKRAKDRDASRDTPLHPTDKEAEADKEKTNTAFEYPADFELLWKAYPKREGSNPKRSALKAYRARLADGVDFTVIQDGLLRYAAYVKLKAWEGTDWVMQAVRFFGVEREFLNDWAVVSANPAVARLWSVMKIYGFASATRFTIEADLARAKAEGKLSDTEAFKRTLNRLNRAALRDAKTDDAAHRIITESLAGEAPEGLAA